jgi:hypothetical protein
MEACLGEVRYAYRMLVGKYEGDSGVGEKMTGVLDLSVSVLGSCGHTNEPRDSIKGRAFLDYLCDILLLVQNSAPMDLQ